MTTHKTNHHHRKPDKLKEAIRLLNEAAHDTQESVVHAAGEKYETLRDLLQSSIENGYSKACEAFDHYQDQLHHARKIAAQKVKALDKSVKDNPWPFVGGASLGFFVLGYLMSKRGKHAHAKMEE